jgi:hypothetical protein
MNRLIRVATRSLTNETHFAFNLGNRRLYVKYGAAPLGIAGFIGGYEQAVDDEDTALERIRKSADTGRIAGADRDFDRSFSGMHGYAKTCLLHYEPEVRHAAENLIVVFERYGNIAGLPYQPALASSLNLLEDLRARTADYQLTGIAPWADAHERAAQYLSGLIDERTSETAQTTDLKVRETRRRVDAANQHILDRIEAMINLNGADYVAGFVAEYNAHATEFKNALAQHLGRIHRENGENLNEE